LAVHHRIGTQTVAAPKLPAVVMPPCVVMAVIRSRCVVAVTVIRRIAIALKGRIPVTVIGPIAVAIAVAVAISVIGPCKRASDERANGKGADSWPPPSSPPGIGRAGRGNRRNSDGGRCCESG
jgi:hypothetical protein